MVKNITSELTVSRLPLYLNYFKEAKIQGDEFASASSISMVLDIHHTQIRKDLATTGLTGKPKVGHNIDEAVEKIEEFLGWNKNRDAFLVGAGNLGSALAGYDELYMSGINIVALFDDSPMKVGQIIHGKPVFHISEIAYTAKTLSPEIGIITTPKDSAQAACNLLVENGVKGIWNFSTLPVETREDVVIENLCIDASLAVLSRKMMELTL